MGEKLPAAAPETQGAPPSPPTARRPRPASPLLPRGFAAWPASGSRDREARRVYREQNVARLRPPLGRRREPGPGARGREAPSGRGRGQQRVVAPFLCRAPQRAPERGPASPPKAQRRTRRPASPRARLRAQRRRRVHRKSRVKNPYENPTVWSRRPSGTHVRRSSPRSLVGGSGAATTRRFRGSRSGRLGAARPPPGATRGPGPRRTALLCRQLAFQTFDVETA